MEDGSLINIDFSAEEYVMDQALCPAIGVPVLQLVDLMLSRECWQLPNDSGWAWE